MTQRGVPWNCYVKIYNTGAAFLLYHSHTQISSSTFKSRSVTFHKMRGDNTVGRKTETKMDLRFTRSLSVEEVRLTVKKKKSGKKKSRQGFR